MTSCAARIALACAVTGLFLSRAAPASAGCECLDFAMPIDGQAVPTNTHFWVGVRAYRPVDEVGLLAGEV